MRTVFRELPQQVDSSIIVKQEIAFQFAAPFHYHDGYEFTLILNGQGKCYAGNRVMNFAAGDIYLFGPQFPHYFVNDETFLASKIPAHSIIIQFQKDFLGKDFFGKPEFGSIRDLLNQAHIGIKISSQKNSIKSLICQAVEYKGVKRITCLLEVLELTSLLPDQEKVTLSPELQPREQTRHAGSKLDLVFEYVLEHFKEDISSQKAAALVFLNEAAFCRYFKRQTQKTFSQFVCYVRVNYATTLLMNRNLSVAEICYESGFNNLSYFNRQFKKALKMSPLQYRKLYYPEQSL